LSELQEGNVEKQIKKLMTWHRGTQLSIYANDLKQIKDYTQAGLTEANTDAVFKNFLHYWYAVREQVSPEMAELFLSLDGKQRLELYKRLKEKNKELEDEYTKTTAEEKTKISADKMVDNVSDWVGELSAEQETMLRSWPEKFKSLYPERKKFRLAWQAKLKAILANKDISEEEKRAQLINLVNKPETYYSEIQKQNLAYNSNQLKALLIDFDKTVSTEQKTYLAARLDHFSKIFSELAAEK